MADIIAAGTAVSGASSLNALVVETFVKPKMLEIAKRRKVTKWLYEHAIENKFSEYLARAYERQSMIKTLVFQNRPMPLKELYLPLTLVDRANDSFIKITQYNQEFFAKNRHVLVTDMAGMGKSTLLRFLFLECIEGNHGIPLFIELRQLGTSQTLVDFIHADLSSICEEIDRDFLSELLYQGDFVFFLDGYDEIPPDIREAVTLHMQTFISKARNNNFILSSRPDDALASFSDFRKFSIVDLSREEAYQLLETYDCGNGLASQITAKLDEPDYQDVCEFLTNPLLVSLLYTAYEYEHDIPLKKHLFYQQVYEALFKRHDLSKEGGFNRPKRSGLDFEEFHTVLRILGFITMKTGMIEYNRDQLLQHITDAKKHVPQLTFREANLIEDLILTVPLFVKEGAYYRWSHKSIQEYFAAQYISRDARSLREAILRKIAFGNSVQNYWNVLDMCYEMDYITFRNSIVFGVATEIVKYWTEAYTQINRSIIPEDDIDNRKSLCVDKKWMLFPSTFFPPELSNHEAQHKNIDKVFKLTSAYIKGNWFPNIETTEFSIRMHPDGGILCIWRFGMKNILSLLVRKKSDLFNYDDEVWWQQNDQEIASINSICTSGQPILVDEDPASLANTKKNFRLVNSLLVLPPGKISILACSALIDVVNRETGEKAEEDIMKGL